LTRPENRELLISLHLMGIDYGCRPSDLLDVPDGYVAYQLDRAIWYVGRKWQVDNATMKSPSSPGLPGGRLSSGNLPKVPSGYRSLLSKVTKKVAIPESGVW
jgi:hypothetical protein